MILARAGLSYHLHLNNTKLLKVKKFSLFKFEISFNDIPGQDSAKISTPRLCGKNANCLTINELKLIMISFARQD